MKITTNKTMDELKSLSMFLMEFIKNSPNENVMGTIKNHLLEVENINGLQNVEIPSGLSWIGTAEALGKSHLKGKIVVLDFFTYCCMNCIHLLPHLKELEEKHKNNNTVVVIGVHSPKFENEKSIENLKDAAIKLGISHPVVNDPDIILWNELSIACWPTLLVLGPKGKPLFVLVGEGHHKELDIFIDFALQYYAPSLSNNELPLCKEIKIVKDSILSYPSKVAVSSCGRRAVSDTGHHRIILFNAHNIVEDYIGGVTPGFVDGFFKTARFRDPQSLAFHGSNLLYIADSGNHVIRLVNLLDKNVRTIVGTGRQGSDFKGGKLGAMQDISSPWGLCIIPAPFQSLKLSAEAFPTSSVPIPPPPPLSTGDGKPPPPPLPPQAVLLSTPAAPPLPPRMPQSVLLPTPASPPLPPSMPKSVLLPTHAAPPLPPCMPPPVSPPNPPAPPNLPIFPPPAPPVPPSLPPPPAPSFAKPPPQPTLSTSATTSINHCVDGPSSSTTLNTKHVLLISMGGSHQIWAYFFEDTIWWKGKEYKKETCVAIAGTGEEENRNNDYPLKASFAQPAGLCFSSEYNSIFVADSESSSVRQMSLETGKVSAVVGGHLSPDNLFSYGDVDGVGVSAKLQHPLDVSWDGLRKQLLVCDSYNHKLKTIDLAQRTCTTVSLPCSLHEPSGITVVGDEAYVADTNGHGIILLRLISLSAKEIQLKSPSPVTTEENVWETEIGVSPCGSNITIQVKLPSTCTGRYRYSSKNTLPSSQAKPLPFSGGFELVFTSETNSVVLYDVDVAECRGDTCHLSTYLFKIKTLVKNDAKESINHVFYPPLSDP